MRLKMTHALLASAGLAALAIAASLPARAYDGWHQTNLTTLSEAPTQFFDYITFDEKTNHVFMGQRKGGLHVYDPATNKLVTTLKGSQEHSANGALIISDMDLGIINAEDGTITPFKLSTLEVKESIKVAEGLDTSHYDDATKTIIVNPEPGKDGTELIVVSATDMKVVGKIAVPTKKAEGAAADGKGMFYLAEQDIGKVAKIDMKAKKLLGEWTVAGCAKPTAIEVDRANNRVFVACRSGGAVKASFVVLNGETGATVFQTEIGDGNDGLAYDPELKRIFGANGVGANLFVIAQTDADKYAVSEVLSTHAWSKVIAMDHKNKKLFGMYAEGTTDMAKKINTAISPFYPNTVVPKSFTIVTYGK